VSALRASLSSFQFGAYFNVGRRVEGELRELIISYGHSGYVALYRFVVLTDEVRILAIRHQREVGFQL
jgi:plasmid stabilization system protein ParE